MMKSLNVSRRNFLHQSMAATGMTVLGTHGVSADYLDKNTEYRKLPREVWIASISQMGLNAETPELMAKKVLEVLKELKPFQPDFVCLPEVFAFTNVKKDYAKSERPVISNDILEYFSVFSRENKCYTICPAYTADDRERIYNSAVVIDRQGNQIGKYDKIHPTVDEIEDGTSPGSLFQPAIKTDSGIIGMQICNDVLWDDGWTMYREQGAEIIFFSSAFPAGQMINTKAWQHKYVVVSSTNKHTSKICDINGEEIAKTGIWNANLCCASVNLEKAFLHLWPYVNRFPEIISKYGRDVRITMFHEEEWAIIESLSPNVRVCDILKEYELKTHEELTKSSETIQNKARA